MTDIEVPESATNILILGPESDRVLELCSSTVGDPARFLVVSFTRPAEDYLDRLRTRLNGTIEELAVIEARDGASREPSATVTIRRESPRDLTAIGVQSNEFVTRWRDRTEPFIVCFDSITGLLQYADLDTAYRFLHVFTGRLHHAGGRGIYHLDPSAHDEVTTGTLRQLFDVVIEHDAASGELIVNDW